MADKQVPVLGKLSRAERLAAIVAKVAPTVHAHQRAHGAWPQRADDERPVRFEKRVGETAWLLDKALTAEDRAKDPENVRQRQRGAAPYEILTLPDDRIRLRVMTDDGGVSVGTGNTLEDAIAAIEANLGLGPAKE